MFKKRLLETFICVVVIPSIIAAWVGLCFLLDKYTPVGTSMTYISQHIPYIMLGLIVVLVVYGVAKFINWLFIEPLKAYRNRNKLSDFEEDINESI